MSNTETQRPNPLHLLAAFGTGGLLTLMVFFNGELGRYASPLFSSWAAHGTGTVAAAVLLAVLWRRRPKASDTKPRAPLWAYLGGLSGAITVMLTSTTVNTPLGLAGTLALGLAGQVVFSLAADLWGLFGLPKRKLLPKDFGALGLVVAGSALIILVGMGAGA
ncbi:membrane protein [Devosia epidermidihirudinis]|uniref:Membrane protein n=1 Tax=Devosia epidermidihirudinis TaxID=1293439 RepID=A0A0F5QL88_9HYPH|nr:DMT family transporter [Devosia epidermidihirudinis]KKC41468.1 membrane protein [Devosia epidermidihirudinis]